MSRLGKNRRESARGKLLDRQNGDSDDSENWSGKLGQVQNKKSARVYVFGNGDIDDEDVLYESSELSEVRSRGKARQEINDARRQEPQEESFIERDVCEGDTLQSIALKYGCRVRSIDMKSN